MQRSPNNSQLSGADVPAWRSHCPLPLVQRVLGVLASHTLCRGAGQRSANQGLNGLGAVLDGVEEDKGHWPGLAYADNLCAQVAGQSHEHASQLVLRNGRRQVAHKHRVAGRGAVRGPMHRRRDMHGSLLRHKGLLWQGVLRSAQWREGRPQETVATGFRLHATTAGHVQVIPCVLRLQREAWAARKGDARGDGLQSGLGVVRRCKLGKAHSRPALHRCHELEALKAVAAPLKEDEQLVLLGSHGQTSQEERAASRIVVSNAPSGRRSRRCCLRGRHMHLDRRLDRRLRRHAGRHVREGPLP
mmetsp:Transcript_15354/g.34888  ORF Transcript_15354/g.34888 Transcript_15354/m.34888 type:complete len:302 (-) Transcript_15354:397-1302(-)